RNLLTHCPYRGHYAFGSEARFISVTAAGFHHMHRLSVSDQETTAPHPSFRIILCKIIANKSRQVNLNTLQCALASLSNTTAPSYLVTCLAASLSDTTAPVTS